MTLPNLANHTTYHYRVRSKEAGGKETVSGDYTFNMDTCIVAPELPSPPIGISSTAGDTQVTITWTAGTGATSSLIRYGTSTGVYTTTIDPAASPQTISSLVNGTPVYYQVGAKNAGGTTWSVEYSVTPAALPQAPTGISATAGNGQSTISWTAGTGGTSSSIRYGTVSGSYPSQLNSVSSPYTITGLANGTTIYYQVGAVNGGGTTWSAQYSILPTAAAPTSASSITATAGNGQATITWTAGAGAASSLIRYGTTTGVYTTTIDPAASPRTITGLTKSDRSHVVL